MLHTLQFVTTLCPNLKLISRKEWAIGNISVERFPNCNDDPVFCDFELLQHQHPIDTESNVDRNVRSTGNS
jgi:hypothetical protein